MSGFHGSARLAGHVLAAVLLLARPVAASESSRRLAAQASQQLYNLDVDGALATFRAAVAADPLDPGPYRGLASALWVRTAFLRGSATVDSYLGRVSGSDARMPPLPADLAAAFADAVDKAVTLAQTRAEKTPGDAGAIYDLGAAIGLRASYTATVEGSLVGAFRSARAAYLAHERVLVLDPSRRDAALIVGIYRYLVATLSLPMRWMAYVAGFGGDKTKGIQFVESAANYPGDSQTEARLALVLLYNRERRYGEAVQQLAVLRDRYPGNRLLWLESGSTSLRDGRAAEAEAILNEGIARAARDTRTKMFGEEAHWYYKRGAARAALGRDTDAASDLRHALAVDGRDWVHGRAQLELGRLALKTGRPDDAQRALQQAVALCSRDSDPFSADQARRLLTH